MTESAKMQFYGTITDALMVTEKQLITKFNIIQLMIKQIPAIRKELERRDLIKKQTS